MEIEDLKKLNILFQTIRKTQIPFFSGNDELDDWIENLIETDATLSGLVCSFLGGEKLTLTQIPEVRTLKEDFIKIISKKNVDFEMVNRCKIYLDLLLEMHEQLLTVIKS
jgi:hypothetical protein